MNTRSIFEYLTRHLSGLTFAGIPVLLILLAGEASAQSLFSVTYDNNRINQLNPDTGAVVNSYPPPLTAQAAGGVGLALSSSTLYYSNIDGPTIFALNPSTGAIQTTFPAPAGTTGIDALGFGTSAFGPTLFAQDYPTDRIFLLNPANGAAFANYSVGFDAIGGIDFDTATGELYVSDTVGGIHALNPNTGAPLHSFSTGTFQTGLGFVGGRLFTASQSVATISERDPVSGLVLHTLPSTGLVGALAGTPVPEPSLFIVATTCILTTLRGRRTR